MCLIKQGFYLELHVGSTLETCAYSMRLNAGGRGGDTIASYIEQESEKELCVQNLTARKWRSGNN